MTAYQITVAKARDAESSTVPGQVARRVLKGVFLQDVSDDQLPKLTNVMHWLYGTGWGAVYGIVAGTSRPSVALGGPLFGSAVWGTSLVELPALQLAPPVWEYGAKEAGLDWSYHLVYGLGVAAAFAALDR